ncbi:MAG: flagellar hook-basal body protein [Clostridia bacterium]|nr:flagellar hook-basal body protein [Clostridia bacterium]
MIRGLYTSGLGMLKETKRLDVIANNLANANTNGFKANGTVNGNFTKMLEKVQMGKTNLDMAPYTPDVVNVYTDFSQGSLISTSNSTDIAIINDDSAFFEVETQDGEKYYTRNGAFLINKEGYLVTTDNYKVLDRNGGYIRTDYEGALGISDTGEVTNSKSEILGNISIRSFENPETLERLGNTYLAMTDTSEYKEFRGEIKQSFLESSNVNTVNEMVNMIAVTRAYEANQKIVQAQDEMLSRANTIGKIG